MVMTIEDLFVEIDHHFLDETRLANPIAFTAAREQNEKWFTSQLSYLFAFLPRSGRCPSATGSQRSIALPWNLGNDSPDEQERGSWPLACGMS